MKEENMLVAAGAPDIHSPSVNIMFYRLLDLKPSGSQQVREVNSQCSILFFLSSSLPSLFHLRSDL